MRQFKIKPFYLRLNEGEKINVTPLKSGGLLMNIDSHCITKFAIKGNNLNKLFEFAKNVITSNKRDELELVNGKDLLHLIYLPDSNQCLSLKMYDGDDGVSNAVYIKSNEITMFLHKITDVNLIEIF